MPSSLPRWLALAAVTAAAAVVAGAVGFPSPSLFAALAVGLVYALTLARTAPLEPPGSLVVTGQALIGVALGAELQTSTLSAVARHWAPIALVTVATLAVSLAAGVTMARLTRVDRPTASLGLVAGGASGIVAMADELGADARLVAFMQYLRVLVVVLTVPPIAHLLLPGGGTGGGAGAAGGGGGAGLGVDLAFTAGCAIAGALLARRVRLTAGALLGPLLLAAALTVSGLSGGAQVPSLVQQVAFAIIGLQVGLRFTLSTVKLAGRLLPAVLGSIVALVAVCAGLAGLLSALSGVSFADAYLATTPGGLYAVLAAAVGSGANTTFVLAVQALRLFAMVLAAPPLVRLLQRGEAVRSPG